MSNEIRKEGGKRKGCLESERILQCDQFGRPAELNFREDSPKSRSALGAFCTVVIVLVTSLFALRNAVVLYKRAATQFTSTIMKKYYDDS